ncbi:MAG: PAS domain-containing protein [Proteobacteria bacterium]|nr:PAS domain-containing protein [Pseudomonadota bacterium]
MNQNNFKSLNLDMLNALLHNTPSVVYTKDTSGKYLLANKRFLQLFQLELDDILGKTDLEIFPSEIASVIISHEKEVIAKLTTLEFEENIKIQNSEHIFNSTKFPIFNQSYEIYAVGTISVDITRYRKNELDLKNANIFLDSIIESIPDMIFIKSAAELRFHKFNKAGEELLGVNRDELLDKNDYDFFPKEQADFFTAKDREVLDKIKYLDINEEPINTKYKGRRFLHTKKIALHDHQGTAQFLLGISQDITDQVNARERLKDYHLELESRVQERTAELQASNYELERINKDLDQFAYIASHDLKAPLRAIDTIAKYLHEALENSDSFETKENIYLLRSRVKKMDHLLDSLLQYSKIGQTKYQSQEVDLKRLIHDIVDLLHTPEDFSLEIIGEMPIIKTSLTPLELVLRNLISNAIKHHNSKVCRIRIACENIGDLLRFSVEDNGPGIPKKYHNKIFEMFYSLSPKEDETNSGMGLALVKKTIETYGGKIRVESNLGEGSSFIFTWPISI